MSENQIEHYGIKGMRWGVRNSLAKLEYRQKTKRKEKRAEDVQDRKLLRIRKRNDRMIRRGLKNLSKMTPEEADTFMKRLKQINAFDKVTEERITSIARTRIAKANTYKSQLEVLDAGLKTAKTGISIAKKASKDSLFKDLSDGLEGLGKASSAMQKKTKTERSSYSSENKSNISQDRINDLSTKYANLTGASAKEAKKQVTNLANLSATSRDLTKSFAKEIEKKKKDKKKDKEGG